MPYDVVVIGAGAAGCALTRRLSADPRLSVLLIEAGPHGRPDVVADPSRWPETLSSELDYGYATVPQAGIDGRSVGVPRGRIVGGTTAINAMIFSIPRADDFDGWGEGWGPDDVLPAFAAIEDHRGSGAGRGHSGPVPNGPVLRRNALCEAFVAAAEQAGHPSASDLNAPDARGAGWFDLSIDQGRRADAAWTFLRPLAHAPNVTIWPDTTATRILFEGGRATGLELMRRGEAEALDIAGELVLSAGAIDSPALLLRSGIGPADDLVAAGIAPVLDLPGVGDNLHDHPSFPVVWSSAEPVDAPGNQFSESCLYLRDDPRTGGAAVSIAFTHVAMLAGAPTPVPHGATALIGLYAPHSRGRLTLDPSDPAAHPLIDPGYLADPRDVEALVGAIGIVREIAQQPALRPYGLTELLPGPQSTDPAAVAARVREYSASYAHHVGTCALGPEGVVGPDLRIHGLDNVRVADASIIPRIPAVAPSATTQVIGWRAAELLVPAPV